VTRFTHGLAVWMLLFYCVPIAYFRYHLDDGIAFLVLYLVLLLVLLGKREG